MDARVWWYWSEPKGRYLSLKNVKSHKGKLGRNTNVRTINKKKGGGKLIVKEVFKKIKKSNHLNRLVTLSPLTEMATHFHERNGAKLIQINETPQNFEYKDM